MKQILVLPTYLLFKTMRPFLPDNHPWKGEKSTLSNWAANSTRLNDQFSGYFWVMGTILLILFFVIKQH